MNATELGVRLTPQIERKLDEAKVAVYREPMTSQTKLDSTKKVAMASFDRANKSNNIRKPKPTCFHVIQKYIGPIAIALVILSVVAAFALAGIYFAAASTAFALSAAAIAALDIASGVILGTFVVGYLVTLYSFCLPKTDFENEARKWQAEINKSANVLSGSLTTYKTTRSNTIDAFARQYREKNSGSAMSDEDLKAVCTLYLNKQVKPISEQKLTQAKVLIG